MNGIFGATDGQTPLDPDESEGLLPEHIATRGQLDEWELANINEAASRVSSKPPATHKLLSENYLRELHRRMFGKTWKWAGTFRRTDKTIGIDWQQVPVLLNQLLENFSYRLEHHAASPDELAAEFHHRLVEIHPFPNGNGRWARMATDLLLQSLGGEPFTWGAAGQASSQETRQRYIAALRAADRGDLGPLCDFMRS